MTDRDQIVLEQLEREWRDLAADIRRERMEELFMQVSAATSRMSSELIEAELTDSERAEVLAIHDQTDHDFVTAIESLNEAQWTFRPGPNRWSVQEIAEHIILTASFIEAGVEQSLSQEPNPSLEEKPGSFETMRLRVLDRSLRGAQAPGPLMPSAQWTVDETLGRFKEVRGPARELLTRPGLPLKSHFYASMPGTFSCYHWLMLVSLHTRRHLAQIVEVKTTRASQGYPQ
jgi:hypothetical protein